jgi:hypothetical protein
LDVLRLTEARSGARVCDPQHLRNVSKPDTHGSSYYCDNVSFRKAAQDEQMPLLLYAETDDFLAAALKRIFEISSQ